MNQQWKLRPAEAFYIVPPVKKRKKNLSPINRPKTSRVVAKAVQNEAQGVEKGLTQRSSVMSKPVATKVVKT
jgi:hypothetical protein